MYHVDNPSTVTEMPEISGVQSAVTQFFTDTEGGDGAPTYPGAEWFNIVQSELLNILTEAGIDPSKADQTQLVQSIKKLSAGSAGITDAAPEYIADLDDAKHKLIYNISYNWQTQEKPANWPELSGAGATTILNIGPYPEDSELSNIDQVTTQIFTDISGYCFIRTYFLSWSDWVALYVEGTPVFGVGSYILAVSNAAASKPEASAQGSSLTLASIGTGGVVTTTADERIVGVWRQVCGEMNPLPDPDYNSVGLFERIA